MVGPSTAKKKRDFPFFTFYFLPFLSFTKFQYNIQFFVRLDFSLSRDGSIKDKERSHALLEVL